MPRFFFIAEDQLDEIERKIDKLPGGETKVTYKMIEQLKETQQLPNKLVEAFLKGPPAAEGPPPPPKGPPAPVGKPDGAPAATPVPPSPPSPPEATTEPKPAAIAKAAAAVAVASPKD